MEDKEAQSRAGWRPDAAIGVAKGAGRARPEVRPGSPEPGGGEARRGHWSGQGCWASAARGGAGEPRAGRGGGQTWPLEWPRVLGERGQRWGRGAPRRAGWRPDVAIGVAKGAGRARPEVGPLRFCSGLLRRPPELRSRLRRNADRLAAGTAASKTCGAGGLGGLPQRPWQGGARAHPCCACPVRRGRANSGGAQRAPSPGWSAPRSRGVWGREVPISGRKIGPWREKT